MKSTIKEAATFLAMGALIMLGVRGVEYLIPAPSMRVVVCTASDQWKVEECRSAAELFRKDGK